MKCFCQTKSKSMHSIETKIDGLPKILVVIIKGNKIENFSLINQFRFYINKWIIKYLDSPGPILPSCGQWLIAAKIRSLIKTSKYSPLFLIPYRLCQDYIKSKSVFCRKYFEHGHEWWSELELIHRSAFVYLLNLLLIVA